MKLPQSKEIGRLVEIALEEDIGRGDATTMSTIPVDLTGAGLMRAGEAAVLAGIPLVQEVFRRIDPGVQVDAIASDGQFVLAGELILKVEGSARSLLAGERVALNFLQRLSGIATLTSRFVQAVQGSKAVILDTRKTTPGWRRLEKYAVSCGGGRNHRMGLFDMIMIKDNHLAALAAQFAEPMTEAVKRARQEYPDLKIEVEADTLDQVQQAVEAGADIILLDNMNLDEMRRAVLLVKGRCQTEASGGVNLETVLSIAETGVDFISVGGLTHSARFVDINMELAMASPSGTDSGKISS